MDDGRSSPGFGHTGGVSTARAPMPDAFVGRDEELDHLLARLSSSGGVGLGPVLISGDPGIGKTRLVAELLDRLDDGWRVASGRAWDEIDCPAYWPWTSAIRELMGAQRGTELRHLVLDHLDDVDRFELLDATAALLEHEAAERPVLVVLDDLHAADVPSLLLTRFVARELLDQPVAVVAVHRPVDPELQPEHHRHLEALAQIGVVVPLTGLSPDQVAALVPDPEMAAEVHEVTGGNPMFVHQFNRASIAVVPSGSEARDTTTTDMLRAAIRTRLALVEPEPTAVIRGLAVLGGSTETPELAAVTGLDPPLVERQLADLALDGLVWIDPQERSASMHSLVAEAVLAGTDSTDLEALHGRAAELLAHDVDRRSERAQHLLRAGAARFDEAVDACVAAAADASAAAAHESAAGFLERAVRALDLHDVGGTEPSARRARRRRRAEVLVELGRALRRADDGERAASTFHRAAREAADVDDPELFALATLRGGIQYFTRNERDPGLIQQVEAALEVLPEGDSSLRARLLADRSARSLDAEQARRDADAAVEMARRLDDPVALGNALIALQLADLGPETLGNRLASAREVMALAHRVGDPILSTHGRCLLFGALIEQGDLRGLDAELRVHGQVDELMVGSTIARLELWAMLTRALLAGQVDEAESLAGRSLDLALSVRDPWGARVYGAQLGTVRWVQGRQLEVEGIYADQHRRHPDEPMWPAILAYIRATDGRIDEAREALAAMGPFDRLPRGIHRLVTMVLAADAIALVGDDDAVAEAREQLLPLADRFVPINLGASVWGPVARPLGLLALRLGRTEEGLAHLARAVSVCTRLGARPWLVESQLLLAESLVQCGRTDDPRLPGLVTEARSAAVDLGLERFIARADALDAHRAPVVPAVVAGASTRPRVSVLGAFEVVSEDGRVAKWNSRKAREMLKFLVARRGAPVHREVVMDLLWPDLDPARLGNRYAVVLNTVRRALDPDRRRATTDLVAADSDTVRLCLDQVEVDAEMFLAQANEALGTHRHEHSHATEALLRAAERHSGPAFPDEPYAEWASPLRDEVRLTHLRVVRALADRAAAAGDHLAAADAFRQLVEADPLDPNVHRGLTEALHRLGVAASADAERGRFLAAASSPDDGRAQSA